MKIKRNTLMTLCNILIWIIAIIVTSIGIWTDNLLLTWLFPVLLISMTLILNFKVIPDLWETLKLLKQKHRETKLVLEIYNFLESVTLLSDISQILEENKKDEGEVILAKVVKLFLEHGDVKQVHGVICGEEIMGYATWHHLVITVSNPETRRAFELLPPELRSLVTILDTK